jgi:hypothetical protein
MRLLESFLTPPLKPKAAKSSKSPPSQAGDILANPGMAKKGSAIRNEWLAKADGLCD